MGNVNNVNQIKGKQSEQGTSSGSRSLTEKQEIYRSIFTSVSKEYSQIGSSVSDLEVQSLIEQAKRDCAEAEANANKKTSAQKSSTIASLLNLGLSGLNTFAQMKSLSKASKAAQTTNTTRTSSSNTNYANLKDSELASKISAAESEYNSYSKIVSDAKEAKSTANTEKQNQTKAAEGFETTENKQAAEYKKQDDEYNKQDGLYNTAQAEHTRLTGELSTAQSQLSALETKKAGLKQGESLSASESEKLAKLSAGENTEGSVAYIAKKVQEEKAKMDAAEKARGEADTKRKDAAKNRDEAKANKEDATSKAMKAFNETIAQQKIETTNTDSMNKAKTELDSLKAEQERRKTSSEKK